MDIRIVKKPISLEEVQALAREIYRDMVKGVADVEREIIALGGEWHMDANEAMLAEGSRQADVWGFNLHVEQKGDDILKFVSLINIRPAQGNRTMELADEKLRGKVRAIVQRLVPELFT